YRGLTLASPSPFLNLPGTRFEPSGEHVTSREFCEYLARYAVLHRTEIEKGDVAKLVASSSEVVVTFADAQERRYPVVVIATGMTDSPALPAIPGLRVGSPDLLVVHSQDWQGPSSLKEGPVLIVGAGMRGVELAEEC